MLRETVLNLLPIRITQQYPINDVLTIHDASNNLIWMITHNPVPDENETDDPNNRLFNKKMVVKFLGKLYKPIIWENIGIAFVTFNEYTKYMGRTAPVYIDNTEDKSFSDEDDIEYLTQALSKIRSTPTHSNIIVKNELTYSTIMALKQPPPAFFKPGKKREKEQIEINKWISYIQEEGYSLEEYKKVYREYRRTNKSSPFASRNLD